MFKQNWIIYVLGKYHYYFSFTPNKMSFSNVLPRIDGVATTVSQQENEMPSHSSTPSSSGVKTLKRTHAKAKELREKCARMEMELRDAKQLGRIRELEKLAMTIHITQFREKFARMELELKNKELENQLLQAVLREQKLLAVAERSALQAKIDKQEQEQQQQRDTVGQLTRQQQNDQKKALCARIGQLEGKQSADFEQLKTTNEARFVSIDKKLSFLLPNWWDATECHGGLTVGRPKCSVVCHKGNGKWCRSVFAKRSIRCINSPNFYFEVKVENLKHLVFIGVATKAMPLDAVVGWHSDSFGYSNSGCFWANCSRKGQMPTFSAGDVVGCGVNFATRQLIFVKNGQRLDTAVLSISSSLDSFFPCVTLCYVGNKIEANFGPDFQFDVGTF